MTLEDNIDVRDMRSIGEMLRGKRKELNLSLKEVENATSIRMNYLEALEEGNVSKLISPIYAQGFFKQYASFLGLDGEQIVRDNLGVFANNGEAQEFVYGIGTLEGRGHPGDGIKWFPNILWILAFIAILIVAWYFARYMGVIG